MEDGAFCFASLVSYVSNMIFFSSQTPFSKAIGPGCNISNTRDSVSSGYPNIEKRVENTTRSGVFLTKLEVFG